MGNNNGKIELTDEIVEDISRTSGIEKKLVRQRCEAFLVKHPSGQMDRKQFREFIKLALPKLNLRKMEKNVFRMYDMDQDGFISMTEFLLGKASKFVGRNNFKGTVSRKFLLA